MKNGYPVVLIHDLFGNLSAPEILRAFGETQVYAPDLIGYGGRSEESTKNITLHDQPDLVAELIAGLARINHEMPNSHLSLASAGNSVRSEIQSVFRTEFPVNTGSVAIIRHFMNNPG